jgi:hypothetical protein
MIRNYVGYGPFITVASLCTFPSWHLIRVLYDRRRIVQYQTSILYGQTRLVYLPALDSRCALNLYHLHIQALYPCLLILDGGV